MYHNRSITALRSRLGTRTIAFIGLLVSCAGCKVYRINSGGPAVVPFSADAYWTGSGCTEATTTIAIDTSGVAEAAPAAVYQSQRRGNCTYSFGSVLI